MSTRDNPFFGSGRFGAKAMQKLNQMARRVEMFGVNSTSPVMATPHGTAMLYRRRNYRDEASSFPWELCQFGWKASDTSGSVTIMTGSVTKRDYTPVVIPQTDVVIGTSLTYVGIQVYRNMTNGSIIGSTSELVTEDLYVKDWFYLFKNTSGSIELIAVNHFGNFNITAYGD